METSSLINMKGTGIMRTLMLSATGNSARKGRIHKTRGYQKQPLVIIAFCYQQWGAGTHSDLSPHVLSAANEPSPMF